MKKYILIFYLLISIQISKAQLCNLNKFPAATVVYVFSERADLTMTQIFGEKVLPALLNIVKVKTEEQKQRIDSLCLSGQIQGVFIFPGNTEPETKRYCTVKEYSETLVKSESEGNVSK